ncbi:TIR domain-containing protein [Polyangium fumosum]|uniref:TIR domain-containing protein n=1 Tax=Polyangium fumosum TaxID=889272 RepID=A0A4U1JGJ7_9BACT|nr:TIR domain-containing protein [Polyangium fumosum]
MPVDVFISFAVNAPKDVEAYRALEKHLAGLLTRGRIRISHTSNVLAGQTRVDVHPDLERAQIILCLLTADYAASRECNAEEHRAYARHEERTASVVPVLVRSLDIRATGVRPAGLHVLPSNLVPVERWPQPDEAWSLVAESIRYLVKNIEAQHQGSTPSYRSSAPSFSSDPRPMHASSPDFGGAHPSSPDLRWSQPHSSLSSPGAGPVYRTPEARSWSRTSWMTLAGIFVVLFCVGIFKGIYGSDSPNQSVSPPSVHEQGNESSVKTTVPVAQTPSGSTCCGGVECRTDPYNTSRLKAVCKESAQYCGPCASGRASVPGACADALSPTQRHWIRLYSVRVNGNDVPDDAQVCFRGVDAREWIGCIPISDAQTRGNGRFSRRVPVTIGDMLERKGLHVEVLVGQTAWATGDVAHDDIKRTALCIGLNMPLTPTLDAPPPPNADRTTKVVVLLDDP